MIASFKLKLYCKSVQLVMKMDTVSVNQFRDKLKTYIEQVLSNHAPIKVTRRAGDAFVVVSADDWEREQETLYVLQNSSLMGQISDSLATHKRHAGYAPTDEQIHEIAGI
jgi:antitoxin YefM